MKLAKLNLGLLVGVGLMLSLSENASAAMLSTWKTVNGPPKQYCVSPGIWGSAPYKCVNWNEAEKVGFDNETVYGGTSGTSLADYTKAQTEMDRVAKDYENQQKTLTTLQEKLARTKEKLGSDVRLTEAERASFKQLESDLNVAITTTTAKVKTAKDALEAAKANTSAGGALDANALKIEIARKGLLIQVSDLENKLGTLGQNLKATEEELNNTVLEAFVVSKIDKIAANFCEANAMCTKDPTSVREFLFNKVSSEQLRNSFKKSTPAAPATAPERK